MLSKDPSAAADLSTTPHQQPQDEEQQPHPVSDSGGTQSTSSSKSGRTTVRTLAAMSLIATAAFQGSKMVQRKSSSATAVKKGAGRRFLLTKEELQDRRLFNRSPWNPHSRHRLNNPFVVNQESKSEPVDDEELKMEMESRKRRESSHKGISGVGFDLIFAPPGAQTTLHDVELDASNIRASEEKVSDVDYFEGGRGVFAYDGEVNICKAPWIKGGLFTYENPDGYYDQANAAVWVEGSSARLDIQEGVIEGGDFPSELTPSTPSQYGGVGVYVYDGAIATISGKNTKIRGGVGFLDGYGEYRDSAVWNDGGHLTIYEGTYATKRTMEPLVMFGGGDTDVFGGRWFGEEWIVVEESTLSVYFKKLKKVEEEENGYGTFYYLQGTLCSGDKLDIAVAVQKAGCHDFGGGEECWGDSEFNLIDGDGACDAYTPPTNDKCEKNKKKQK